MFGDFKFIFSARGYSLCEYHGRIIHLPKDIDINDDNNPISVFFVSQATYQDTEELLLYPDAANLEIYLVNQSIKEGIKIIIE